MFGIGGFELLLILVFGFLIVGPERLPELAKTVGKAIAKFRTAQDEMSKVVKDGVFDPTSDQPFKDPSETIAKAADVVASVAGADSGQPKPKPKQAAQGESFSERKARYEAQRAAKAAAEHAPENAAEGEGE